MPTDATTSPVPAWKRYATIGILILLVVVAPYVIYVKEIKHSSSSSGSPAGASAPAPSPPATTATTKPVATTIPGGVPLSSRNPLVPSGS